MFQIKINIKIAINIKKKHIKRNSDQFINEHNLERIFLQKYYLNECSIQPKAFKSITSSRTNEFFLSRNRLSWPKKYTFNIAQK